MGKLLISLLLLGVCSSSVSASPPFVLKHPDTQEEGVWIPVYVQRYHLETEVELHTCRADRGLLLEQRDELKLALRNARDHASELQSAFDVLDVSVAFDAERTEELEVKLQRRTRWAWASTVFTAISALSLGAYAAAKRR